MHVVQASLIDDADDGQRGVLSGWNLRAERTARRKKLLRENRIDEHFTHTIPAGTLERASGQYSHPHDLGVGRANADVVDERVVARRIAGDAGRAGDRHRILAGRGRQRQRRRRTHARHTWYGRERVFYPLLDRQDIGGVREELRDDRHAHREKAVRPETRIGDYACTLVKFRRAL